MSTKKSPAQDPTQEARKINFVEMLKTRHGGRFAKQLNEVFGAILAHTMSKGGKCSMTIDIAVAPSDESGVNVACSVKHKIPAPKARAEHLYADENGQAYVDNHRQTELLLGPLEPAQMAPAAIPLAQPPAPAPLVPAEPAAPLPAAPVATAPAVTSQPAQQLPVAPAPPAAAIPPAPTATGAVPGLEPTAEAPPEGKVLTPDFKAA